MSEGMRVLKSKNTLDRQSWLNLWQDWPSREPFAHPTYAEAFLDPGYEAVCAVKCTPTGRDMLPLIQRTLTTFDWAKDLGYSDLTTPYGYGGAYFWGEVDGDAFWNEFDEWAGQNKIVSLFARLSLFPNSILPFRGNTRYVMDNIVRSLDLNEDLMWMDYEHKVRKNVLKSKRNDVQVEWDHRGTRLKDFQTIYKSTMVRREASQGYFFSDSFFRDLIAGCADSVAFIHATRHGRVISSEMLLVGSDHVYSFLGGTESDSFELRPNDLLKHEIIRWCRDQGKSFFVLGGGLSADDGLVRYKNSFAPKDGRVPFYVGERILDYDANEELILRRKKIEPEWESDQMFFPSYRSLSPVKG